MEVQKIEITINTEENNSTFDVKFDPPIIAPFVVLDVLEGVKHKLIKKVAESMNITKAAATKLWRDSE